MQELVRRVKEALRRPWKRSTGRPKSLGLYQAVEAACMYLRQNATQEFIGDMRDASQPTISRYVAELVPIVKTVLVEEQFLAALMARNPAQYRVQDLSNQLRMAIEEKQQCGVEIAALHEAMHSRQEEIYRLEMEEREIRAAWASAQQAAETEGAKDQQHRHELAQAIEKLEQVARLRKRLQNAQRRAKTAEHRCQRLEQELDAASVSADEQSIEELTRMREQLRTSEELLAQASQR